MTSKASVYRRRRIQQRDVELGYALTRYHDFATRINETTAIEVQIQEAFRETEDDSHMEVSSNADDEMNMDDQLDADQMDIDIYMNERLQEDTFSTKRPSSTKDIAAILILFKQRHNLSIECISDLLLLLTLFGIDNVPSSWYQLKEHLTPIKPSRTYFTPCESCMSASTNASRCSECGRGIPTNSYVKTFINFSITNQLEVILNNSSISNLFSSCTSNVITDIKHGDVYTQLKRACHDRFLTFTMNIDGVEVKKKTNKSIWPILLVINELPVDQRYNLENVIIAGVWLAPHKPSRLDMKCLLSPVVEELRLLENGYMFQDCRNFSNNPDIMIRVFLIAACCDKPAQALIQNIPEPIARFGCGRCEIEGTVMKTSARGSTRSFAMTQTDLQQIKLRSNQRYDILLYLKRQNEQRMHNFLHATKKQQDIQKTKHAFDQKGILGECVLRSLAFFDVGISFMADSLHNVYTGAFKRMLHLWFHQKYSAEKWSIKRHLPEISRLFVMLRFPSTTTRLPRNLLEYQSFKANELRILLLFGHSIFSRSLKKEYYAHLLQLVVLMHLAESRKISQNHLSIIQQLSESFVMQFSELYTRRHVVQVVHSVSHVAATVKDFGPLTNFTTFNFESVLGKITRTTKGTRRHAEEMISSLHYLQASIVHLKQSTLDIYLENFISAELYYSLAKPDYSIRLLHETSFHHNLSSIFFPEAVIKTFDVLYIGHMRISTVQYADGKKADDSNIIFRLNDRATFGRVTSIFTADNQQPFLLVDYFEQTQPLRCNLSVNGPEFLYNRVVSVNTASRNTCFITTSDFIEKCVYFQPSKDSAHFYQFPTLRHST